MAVSFYVSRQTLALSDRSRESLSLFAYVYEHLSPSPCGEYIILLRTGHKVKYGQHKAVRSVASCSGLADYTKDYFLENGMVDFGNRRAKFVNP